MTFAVRSGGTHTITRSGSSEDSMPAPYSMANPRFAFEWSLKEAITPFRASANPRLVPMRPAPTIFIAWFTGLSLFLELARL